MCYGFRLEVLSGSQLTVLLKLRSQKFFYISDQCFDVIYQVSYNEAMNIQLYLEFHLKPTWDWLITVMDSTEAQLRFGSALSETTDPNHPSHPLHRLVAPFLNQMQRELNKPCDLSKYTE